MTGVVPYEHKVLTGKFIQLANDVGACFIKLPVGPFPPGAGSNPKLLHAESKNCAADKRYRDGRHQSFRHQGAASRPYVDLPHSTEKEKVEDCRQGRDVLRIRDKLQRVERRQEYHRPEQETALTPAENPGQSKKRQ